MKILVAEDQVVSRHILVGNLRKWGYEVTAVEDGTRAWEALQAEDAPQVAVLDWLMPGMDGIEICRQIRQRPQPRPTYLILLTARRGQEDKIHGLQAGADDYITKPFDHEELRARVQVGFRVLELQVALARARAGIGGGAFAGQDASGVAADLLLLQEDQERSQLLAAGGRLYQRPFRSPVQPRDLPGLLRPNRPART